MNVHLEDVSKIIQLSIAPVFLLSGVGTQLVVLTNRLARITDRSRALEEKLQANIPVNSVEIDELYLRAHLINRAIALSSICAFLICLVIVTLFLEDATDLNLPSFIAAIFVLGIVALTGSFAYFLREISIATQALKRDRLRRSLKNNPEVP